MSKLTFPYSTIFLVLTFPALIFSISAQGRLTDANTSRAAMPIAAKSFFSDARRGAALGMTATPETPGSGSITGRVFNDVEMRDVTFDADSLGVSGVRIILRSAKAGSQNILGNRISDAAGKYYFEELPPGSYTIELDPVSIPAKFRLDAPLSSPVLVQSAGQAHFDVPLVALRNITGIVFIDNDNDARYRPGKDLPVKGACITVNGKFAVSDDEGHYIIRDLPAGRLALLVSWPHKGEFTHVVLHVGPGPDTERIVNISTAR